MEIEQAAGAYEVGLATAAQEAIRADLREAAREDVLERPTREALHDFLGRSIAPDAILRDMKRLGAP